jgi:hypothetical protein
MISVNVPHMIELKIGLVFLATRRISNCMPVHKLQEIMDIHNN